MSYDLAVWEGDQPADDAAAGEVYDQGVSAEAARTAAFHGLVCHDPQWERLRSTAEELAASCR